MHSRVLLESDLEMLAAVAYASTVPYLAKEGVCYHRSMNILLIIVTLLIVTVSYMVYMMGLVVLSLLFYKFITKAKRVTKRQVIASTGAIVALWIVQIIVAIASEASFGGNPNQPTLNVLSIVFLVSGLLSLNISVGCVAARLAQNTQPKAVKQVGYS